VGPTSGFLALDLGRVSGTNRSRKSSANRLTWFQSVYSWSREVSVLRFPGLLLTIFFIMSRLKNPYLRYGRAPLTRPI
jgi:hypothetical protein